MTEKLDKLVRMANDIADFFRPYPEEKAVAGVQEHMRSFWTKRMREELAAYAASGGTGLNPRTLKALAQPAAAESPTAKVKQGPEKLGQLESDAG